MTFSFDVGSAIGGLAGLAGSFMSNASSTQMLGLSKEAQKELMKYQAQLNWQYYNKDLNKNKYSLARKQLEEANYNPYLMPGAQLSGNANWTSPQSVTDLGAGANAIGANTNAIGLMAQRSQQALNDSQISLNGATAEVANQDVLKKRAETENVIQDTNRRVIENLNLPDRIEKEFKLMDKQARYFGAVADTSYYNAESQRIMANAAKEQANVSGYNALTLRMQVQEQVRYLKKQGILTGYQAQEILERLPYVRGQELWSMYQKFGIGTGSILGGITGVGNFGMNLYDNLYRYGFDEKGHFGFR